MICKKFESSGIPCSCRHAWMPPHHFAVPKSSTQPLTVGSVAFEEAGAHRVTPPLRPRLSASRAIWPCRLAWQTVENRVPSWSRCCLYSQGSCVHEISDRKVVARCPGVPCDQIERKASKKLQSLQ